MMKDVVSTCEKNFLLQAIGENLRLDGRQFNEYRQETIHFGVDWGSCLVTLGETRVLAQVSCDIQPPKASKPNEGLLYVHVEMSPMAALHFESNRQSDISVQVNRSLEKCLKESKCVDLEALCIVADEKVWNIRIDLNVMNYEGNLTGCCSIAALAALAHFKHPDVTSTGEKIIIHSFAEKDPIPINLHHYPVIISYALFHRENDEEKIKLVSDPTALEEVVADSLLMLSVNSYHEICGMHLEGLPLPSTDIVVKCAKNAIHVTTHLVKQIKKALANDLEQRSKIPFGGLTNSLNVDHISTKLQETLKIELKRENTWEHGISTSVRSKKVKMETDEDDVQSCSGEELDMETEMKSENIEIKQEKKIGNRKIHSYKIEKHDDDTAALIGNNNSSEDSDNDNDVLSQSSDDVEIIPQKQPKREEIQLSSDDEEVVELKQYG